MVGSDLSRDLEINSLDQALTKIDRPVSLLKKIHGENQVMGVIAELFSEWLSKLNIGKTFSNLQMADLVIELMKEYHFLSIEEFAYVIRGGVLGRYGQLFGRVDISVVGGWFVQHIQDTASIRERKGKEILQKQAQEEARARNEKLKLEYERKVASGEIVPAGPIGIEVLNKKLSNFKNRARLDNLIEHERQRDLAKYIMERFPDNYGTVTLRLYRLWAAMKEAPKSPKDMGGWILVMRARLEGKLEKMGKI